MRVSLALVSFFTALAISLVLTPAVRSIARRRGLVAAPRSDRWHEQPTALIGGAAIFLSFLIATLFSVSIAALWPLVLGGAYMFGVGLVDDVMETKPASKLVLQLIGGAAVAAAGYRFDFFESHTLDVLVTIFWIVGITNAFNLLDNMDGLAAGVALLAGAALLVLAVRDGAPTVGLLAAFCGALAGFLVFNFNPASIFMGDSGSLFVGSFLASITLVPQAHPRSQLLSVLAGPLLILLVPILDTSFVAITRTLAGRSISVGGRDHTSHRLVAIGLSERRAVVLLWIVAAGGGLLAVSMPYASPGALALALTVYLVAVGLLLVHLGTVAVYDEDDAASIGRQGTYTPLLVELTYRRRVFEVLLDFLLAGAAYYTAYRLRFEGQEFSEYFPVFLKSLPLVLASRTLALWLVGTYRGVWRYFGIADLGTLIKGVGLGSAGAILCVVYFFRFDDFSRGVFIIDALLFGTFIAGSRLSFRIIADYARRKRPGRRVVVYGAGDGGALVIREMRNNHRMGLVPVAFIDDDPRKRGRLILGVPVLGGRDRLHELLSAGGADEVVISTLKLPPDDVRELAAVCDSLQVPVYMARVVFHPVGSVTTVH